MLPPRLLRIACCLLLICAGVPGAWGQTQASSGTAKRTLTLEGLGNGAAGISGNWQFHLGDDPAWSSPELDDSHWATLAPDSPWGAQGYPSYTGYAWYRRHIAIHPAPGKTQYSLLVPDVEDAYEVFWNGKPIGHYGRFPPHALWYYSVSPQVFPLTGAMSGVLAIRVWKAPLDIFSLAESGGISVPPIVGDRDTVSLYQQEMLWSFVQQDLFDYSLILLRVFIAVLCAVLWFRAREEQLFLWVGVFTLTPVALGILQNLFLIPISYALARFINQPVYALWNISLWFLLVYLLRLDSRPRLYRLTRLVAWVTIGAAFADGLLALFWGSATTWMQWADAILAGVILLAELFPFVLIAAGLQRKLDAARWTVAIAALVSQLLQTAADASALGRRYTHFSLYEELIDNSSFQIQGVVFSPEKLTSLALFAAILYAVYRYILEQQARRTVLEQEMQSAREIQQVLIPETMPSLEGYSITSAYTPAQEVGGDFFQIIANPDGSTLVALGDVSGKGLKAAMNVSMILGAMRAQAATSGSPAEIIRAVNECLVGRMQGGFATGIVLRLDRNGKVKFANAGHLPPFVNGRELPMLPSLPLGLLSDFPYDEQEIQLRQGDQLSFYTDGLLEAKNEAGEMFGFERLHELFARRPTAEEASQAAVEFGQDDDITVLILTRLAEGEESTTKVLAPVIQEPASV